MVPILYLPRISTSNIDAIAGNDYGSITNRQISFSPGDATQTVSVTISDDTTVENNERFRATLTAENGVDIRPGGGEAIVTIVDNDGAYFVQLWICIKFNTNS